MNARQDEKRERSSNPCAAAGRIIALLAVTFAGCALVKSFVCGQGCESCPCGDDCGSNSCSCQSESPESG